MLFRSPNANLKEQLELAENLTSEILPPAYTEEERQIALERAVKGAIEAVVGAGVAPSAQAQAFR